jgi:uncharacterized membrane protein YfcA
MLTLEFFIIASALLLGGLIKGLSGIGLPMVALPILTTQVSIQDAILLLTLPILFSNLVQAKEINLRHINQTWLLVLLSTLLVGITLGSFLLFSYQHCILLVTALSLTLYSLIALSGYNFKIKEESRVKSAALTGSIAGFIGGGTSLYGWPLVIYTSALNLSKRDFISTISAIYLIAHLYFMATLLFQNMLTKHSITYSLAASIPVFIGILIGQKFNKSINQELFYKLIQILILTGGILLFFQLPNHFWSII